MFVTFEGLDFCGKSTQIKLLETYLKKEGEHVLLVREPGGTAISEKIRNILLDKKNDGMTSETELLLFNAARAQLVREQIRPYIENEGFVISDRFYDSSVAYQGGGRGMDMDLLTSVINLAVGDTRPDRTYLLDIDVEQMNKRKRLFSGKLDRMESSTYNFFERVRRTYLKLAKQDHYMLIDGNKSIEEINSIIIKDIKDMFMYKTSLK